MLFDTSNNTSAVISHKIPVASWGQGGLLDIISEGNVVWVTCSIMKDKLLTTAVYKSTLKNNSLIITATHSDNVLKKCDLIINL